MSAPGLVAWYRCRRCAATFAVVCPDTFPGELNRRLTTWHACSGVAKPAGGLGDLIGYDEAQATADAPVGGGP